MTALMNFSYEYFDELSQLLNDIDPEIFDDAVEALYKAIQFNRKIFIIGNGGSAATASHFAQDLERATGKFVLSLTDSAPRLTAIANDYGYSKVFKNQLESLSSYGDMLIIFSVSGNSPNLLEVLHSASELGLTTIGFLGCDGGDAKYYTDHTIIINDDHYGRVEDVHLVLAHVISAYLKKAIKG